MTDTTVEIEESETTEPSTKKRVLKPIVKKVLIWGGVALGAVAVLLLVKPSKDDEQDYIIVEEIREPDGTTTTTTVEPISD